MKRILTAVAVFSGVMIYAGALKINGEFKPGKKELPAGWLQNKGGWAKPFGKVEVVAGSKNNIKAMKITSTKKSTHVYTGTMFPVKVGDKVELSFKVKGKGKGSIGIYSYDNKGWIVTDTQSFAAKPEWGDLKKTIKVVPGKKTIKGKVVEKVPTKIRIVLIANSKSEISFEEVKAEVISAK